MKKYIFSTFLLPTLVFAANPNYDIIEDKNPLQILSPSLAKRETAKIRLKNGLEVLLISDPDSDQSAAALAVEAGSWNDPVEYPGMAHFCEHMVFMGSKKYPDEDCFMQWVKDAGGKPNAYTKPDRTVFMFSSNHYAFRKILDNFAHFFIDPLFKADMVKRELLAVNQEHLKNVEHDGWREYRIFQETGNPNHPNAKFGTGTEDTLSIIPLETLKNWHGTHYVANKMHLAIYSNEPIDALIKLANETFSAIHAGSSTSVILHESLTSPQQRGHILYIEPIQDIRKISIGFEIPSYIAVDIDSRTPYLLGYTLTYKGEHSLYEQLKKEGLAEDISFECDAFDPKTMMLNFTVQLTKEGVLHHDTVILRMFEAIHQIKQRGIPPYVFHEARKMANLNYQWQSRIDAFNYVTALADDMIGEPLDTFPYKSTTLHAFKPTFIRDTLAKMTLENAVIIVVAPSSLTKRQPDRKEQWLGGAYSFATLDEAKQTEITHMKGNPYIGNPAPNPFIPGELMVSSEQCTKENCEPYLLADEPAGKCYFMQDHFYLVPELSVKLGLKSPLINSQTKSIALTDLFILHLERKLSPYISQGERAGLKTSLYQRDLMLNVCVSGYYDKNSLLISNIFDAMRGEAPTRELFAQYKESLLSQYENQSKTLPIRQAFDCLQSILFNNAPTGKDLHDALMGLTYDDFLNYHAQVFSSVYMNTVITGCADELTAKALWQRIKEGLPGTIYPIADHTKREILVLPLSKGPYILETGAELQGNATLLMLQLGKNLLPKQASEQILSKALSEAFFTALRTKQQTGYITQSFGAEEQNELMLFFAVHSTTHYSQELLARFELFIEDFNRNLETYIPEERFQFLKTSLITLLSKPPQNLEKKASELYNLAFQKNGNFLQRQEQIAALEKLTYDTFKADVQTFLTRQNTRRVAILVTGPPSNNKAFSYIPATREALKSLSALK